MALADAAATPTTASSMTSRTRIRERALGSSRGTVWGAWEGELMHAHSTRSPCDAIIRG